ncbi:MAG: glucosamine-6-phosphate deaminase [Pedococcus sp.]
MEVVILADDDAVGEAAAAKIAQIVDTTGPGVVLGLATGSSPGAAYRALARRVDSGTLDLTSASAFALDEYVGLPPGHPQSYRAVIDRDATRPLRLSPERVHTPDGFAPDIPAAAASYEDRIHAAGGVDVQILGVGTNGHIGFNEPGSSLGSRTRIKTLTQSTRHDNRRFFSSLAEVPRHCLTQGLGTIMDARHVVLLAQGDAKADAIAQVCEGPITTMCPGSVLQLHERATVIIDESAASKLRLAGYYKETFAAKPQWQRFL